MRDDNFHRRIKRLREERGWTQTDVANALELAQGNYQKYEKGTLPKDPYLLLRLARLYKVSVEYLLTGSDDFLHEGGLQNTVVKSQIKNDTTEQPGRI